MRYARRAASRRRPTSGGLPTGKCRARGARRSAAARLGQIVRPLDSVGCYVPGGSYPLPSTLLMTAIPAQVAGVERIVVVSPESAAGDAGGGVFAGRSGDVPLWRSAGDRGACLRNRDDRAGGQDRWAGQRLCHGGQEVGQFRLRDRHARRARPRLWCIARQGTPDILAADLVAQAEHDPDAVVVFSFDPARCWRKQSQATCSAPRKEMPSRRGDQARTRMHWWPVARAGDGVGEPHRRRTPYR